MHPILAKILERNKDIEGRFQEEPRGYFVGEKELIGSTTFIHKYFPFDKDGISKSVAFKQKKTQAQVLAEWGASADFGTRIHNAIEDYINNKKVTSEDLTEIATTIKFLDTYGLKNVGTEIPIFSSLGVASQIDWLFEDKDGNLGIIDWKTSKEIYKKNNFGEKALFPLNHLDNCNYLSYSLQISLYKFILENEYGVGPIKHIHIIHIRDKKTKVIKAKYLHKELVDLFFTEWEIDGSDLQDKTNTEDNI